MNSPHAQDQKNGNFTQTSDWFTYNQSARNRPPELDRYKRAFALVQLRTRAERLHFRGNVYALDAQQLTQEIESRERRISEKLSLGTTIKEDEGDTHVVRSVDFIKDDEGARTVELFRIRDRETIRIPLYDLLSRTWSIETGEVVMDLSQISLKKIGDYYAYFRQRLLQLLDETTVDISLINSKAKILAKTAKEKNRKAVNSEYLETTACEAADELRLRNR